MLVDGVFQSEPFLELIGNKIVDASKDHRPVRIFGELVALLWAEEKRREAIQLEAYWNTWLKKYPFQLMCAYPLHDLSRQAYERDFVELCQSHTHVIPTESYTAFTSEDASLRTVALLQQQTASLRVEQEERLAAQRLAQAKDQFLSMASHELKTPLTSLQGFLALVQKYETTQAGGNDTILRCLSLMKSQIERMTRLIGDLFDVSQMQAGTLTYQHAPFAIDALVQESVETVQATTSTHLLHLEGLCAAHVNGDRDRIEQVIINLLNNAIKYSPNADRVIMRVERNIGFVHLYIQDFGMGIAPEHQHKIFEQFYRVKQTQKISGLGIGLFICREIVQHHQGQLWVESAPDYGTTFHMILPRSADETPFPEGE